jgi:predicted RNase H-like nuclease (RuvC/YqgF family)
MKTVEFKYRGEGLYIVDGEQNWGDSYGTYVLASEATERTEVLEIENNKLSELFDAAGVDNNNLHKHIKVMKNNLESLMSVHRREVDSLNNSIKIIDTENTKYQERIKVLENTLKEIEQDHCIYCYAHKLACASLEVKP